MFLFPESAATLDAITLEGSGEIVVAGTLSTTAGPVMAVACLTSSGSLDSTFGNGGTETVSMPRGATLVSVSGVAVDPARGILFAGTASSAATGQDFFVTRLDFRGNLDESFDAGRVETIDFHASNQSDDDFDPSIVIQQDGDVILAGTSTGLVSRGQLFLALGSLALARLKADGTPDFGFGEFGQVITTLGPFLGGSSRSALLQPDGAIVVTGTGSSGAGGLGLAPFVLARFVGGDVGPSGSGTIAADNIPFVEDFANDADPSKPALDVPGFFVQNLWYNLQAAGAFPADEEGQGWVVGASQSQSASSSQLQLTGAVDDIAFPNVVKGVEIALATVLVLPSGVASSVMFVGENGNYEIYLPPSSTTQTVSAGEDHVLEGSLLDPTLELGPIRQIILTGDDTDFEKIQVLVVPTEGPLDQDVTAPPNQPTTFDVLTHADAEASLVGLTYPLTLLRFTQPDLSGSTTEQSSQADPDKIVFDYTATGGEPKHPSATFTYIVQDALGATALGTVQVTIDSPPVITISNENFVFPIDSIGVFDLQHGTSGPLTAAVLLTDPDGRPGDIGCDRDRGLIHEREAYADRCQPVHL